MAHRILTQIVVTGSRVIGRAAVEAFRHAQAMSAYQKHHGVASGSSGSSNLTGRGALTLDEAYKILHVKPNVEHESILERYKKLFEVNDPKKGGSFYLQSKIHRARER
ncbi:protein transporter [Ascodesmis nigricans]|uniref:Mitochondrial import inner membrane translocase subunit TIM16 n=1 Tax=Ascodesmis nigricans TaxID=341454 RepID=A0A4S2ML03_9PEZI|nr:protein transporter [Ascodesmis nigricans]